MQFQFKEIARTGHTMMELLACLVKLAVSLTVRLKIMTFKAHLLSECCDVKCLKGQALECAINAPRMEADTTRFQVSSPNRDKDSVQVCCRF